MIKSYKELIAENITNEDIKSLILSKKLYKIEKGLYSTTKKYNELELIQKKYVNSIITMNSALFFYNLIDKKPKEIHIATPHKAKNYKNDNLKQYFISDNLFEIGKINIDGIKIYDRERLLIEVVRNKKKFNEKEYQKIVENYKKDSYKLDYNKINDYLYSFSRKELIIEEIDKIHFNYKEVKMKGIVLAGGSGTRLYPITEGVSKQLLPIYDKPMIYYPVSVLMLAGIRDILIITTPEDQPAFKRLLKDGKQFGVNFEYVVQPSPDGLAQAFILGEKFIDGEACAMVLGDNIFYGNGFVEMLSNAAKNAEKGSATNFGIEVPDPERFGIMEIEKKDNKVKIISVEEKPLKPKSNYAITGLYFYPKDVVKKAKEVKPSARGELEITTLNDMYLKEDKLLGELLGGGFSWFDTGTFESLFDATSNVKSIEQNRGRIIACLEQIAFDNGWISLEELKTRGELLKKNSYGQFLLNKVDEESEK